MHKLRLPDEQIAHIDEDTYVISYDVIEWVEQNCIGKMRWQRHGITCLDAHFEEEQDAVLFKMRWY